jgi:hypothetical protein
MVKRITPDFPPLPEKCRPGVNGYFRQSLKSVPLLLLAQSGHSDTLTQCPLSAVKQTSVEHSEMSAYDPKRTSLARLSDFLT